MDLVDIEPVPEVGAELQTTVLTTNTMYNTTTWEDNCIQIIYNNFCTEEAVVELPADVIFATTDISAIKEAAEPPPPPPVQPVAKKSLKVKVTKDLCKKARNSGQMYWKLNGKDKGCIIEGKSIGPPCNCPYKCFEKLGKETVNKIFRDFWALADYNSQNAYLFGFISMASVKRRYTKNLVSRRNFTVSYSVKQYGQNIKICKQAFLNIHGLQRNRGRVNNIVLKMKEGESVPTPDKRGRHGNRPHAYSTEDIEHVVKHLGECPKVRRKTGKLSKILEQSTRKCYDLYVDDYCQQYGLSPVSFDKYKRVAWSEGYKALPAPLKVTPKNKKTTHVASQTTETR